MELFSFKKFIFKYLKYEPLHSDSIKEPEDALGLSIVTFPTYKNKQIHIECTNNRKIYCECLDYNNYKKGEMIPLYENNIRHVIVSYMDLNTDEDAKKISEIINDELANLYSDVFPINDNSSTSKILYNQMMFKDYFTEIFDILYDINHN